MSYPTCRTHPRTLAQAFPDVRASWGDEVLMTRLRLIDTKPAEPGDTQPEAASAVSEFGHEEKPARTHPIRLSLWARFVRSLRARRLPKGPL